MLDLSSLDVGEIATALADQTDYEHRWLINPDTGEVVFWTSDTGVDGQTAVDLDELDLVCIVAAMSGPIPSEQIQDRGEVDRCCGCRLAGTPICAGAYSSPRLAAAPIRRGGSCQAGNRRREPTAAGG